MSTALAAGSTRALRSTQETSSDAVIVGDFLSVMSYGQRHNITGWYEFFREREIDDIWERVMDEDSYPWGEGLVGDIAAELHQKIDIFKDSSKSNRLFQSFRSALYACHRLANTMTINQWRKCFRERWKTVGVDDKVVRGSHDSG